MYNLSSNPFGVSDFWSSIGVNPQKDILDPVNSTFGITPKTFQTGNVVVDEYAGKMWEKNKGKIMEQGNQYVQAKTSDVFSPKGTNTSPSTASSNLPNSGQGEYAGPPEAPKTTKSLSEKIKDITKPKHLAVGGAVGLTTKLVLKQGILVSALAGIGGTVASSMLWKDKETTQQQIKP